MGDQQETQQPDNERARNILDRLKHLIDACNFTVEPREVHVHTRDLREFRSELEAKHALQIYSLATSVTVTLYAGQFNVQHLDFCDVIVPDTEKLTARQVEQLGKLLQEGPEGKLAVGVVRDIGIGDDMRTVVFLKHFAENKKKGD